MRFPQVFIPTPVRCIPILFSRACLWLQPLRMADLEKCFLQRLWEKIQMRTSQEPWSLNLTWWDLIDLSQPQTMERWEATTLICITRQQVIWALKNHAPTHNLEPGEINTSASKTMKTNSSKWIVLLNNTSKRWMTWERPTKSRPKTCTQWSKQLMR